MTEIEQLQRLIRITATTPPHVAEALAVVLEWMQEQNAQAAD